MNVGKLLGKGVDAVKRNPELALAVAGLLAPKLATKVVSKVVEVKAVQAALKG